MFGAIDRTEKAFFLDTELLDRLWDNHPTLNTQMSEEQLKAFLEKIKDDTTLQEQLKAATNADAVV